MPVPCHFQCGDAATTWSWNDPNRNSHLPALRDITVYTCPQCGIYGLTGRLEAALHGTESSDRQIEKQFLLMREELLKRRPEEAPTGSALVGVFSLGEDTSTLELGFISPKDPGMTSA